MIDKDWKYTFERNGLKLTANIPPYVWMYKGGKIDIDIKDECGCDQRYPTTLNMNTNAPAELEAFVNGLDDFATSVCKVCSKKILYRLGNGYRSADECEICCLRRLREELKILQEKEAVVERQQDMKAYSLGHRYKIIVSTHPVRGGSDRMYTMYASSRMTMDQIKDSFKGEVVDSHRIEKLKL